MNEVRSFVESGLKDISISRKSIKWGIPWPEDPEHVFYVWYDALTSYMTGIGFVDGEHDGPDFGYWPADVHMIGKEIIRFHAVYWPAFLMAAEMALPKRVQAHGWLLFEQEKMSKSKGNVAYAEPIVKVLGDDALRYYLLRETVFGQDGNFSRDALITRYEADLVSGLGNLASRVLALIETHFDGIVPARPAAGSVLSRNADAMKTGAVSNYDAFHFSLALEEIWTYITLVDNYLTTEQPWKKIQIPEERQNVGAVLYEAAEAVRFISILAHPVVPDGTGAIWKHLGQSGMISDQSIGHLRWGGLEPGTRVSKPAATFPRVEHQETSERIEAMEQEIRNPTPAAPAASPTGVAATPAAGGKITIEDFAKVEMRVGVVKSAERIQGADKLLKVMVDIGDEVRQVLAGIAQYYTPEDLVGRKVVVVVNLAPRKMRGLESNGMIVAASVGPEGKPVLATFTEDVPAGARLK
jgi:methionyl-tRNA synthetase